jgi:hypothetical protein
MGKPLAVNAHNRKKTNQVKPDPLAPSPLNCPLGLTAGTDKSLTPA